jgi:glycosyltransferase involved in cell wall biosynthesis
MQNEEFKEVRLVLAGEGEESYEQFLKSRIKDHHAAESIVFPGWLAGERKDVALQNASLLALPSRQENFGVCVMESLACGVPVLVSPQVNLSQQIETAGAGWITELDETKLKAALIEALRSPTERASRGKAGHELAKSFTWPIVASQLSRLYQSVAKAPARLAIA